MNWRQSGQRSAAFLARARSHDGLFGLGQHREIGRLEKVAQHHVRGRADERQTPAPEHAIGHRQ